MQNIQLPTPKTKAQKLHIECVVQLKNTNYPLVFTIVYGLAFHSSILEEESGYFRRIFLLTYTMLNWFVFQKGEILIWLDYIFEGRKGGIGNIMWLTYNFHYVNLQLFMNGLRQIYFTATATEKCLKMRNSFSKKTNQKKKKTRA